MKKRKWLTALASLLGVALWMYCCPRQVLVVVEKASTWTLTGFDARSSGVDAFLHRDHEYTKLTPEEERELLRRHKVKIALDNSIKRVYEMIEPLDDADE